MLRIRECTDIEECRRLWKQFWPAGSVFDVWEVRDCFHRSFSRPITFLVAERDNRIQGILPLSWIDESGYFAVFPGETWQGKTWLEQNKIPAADPRIREDLLSAVSKPAHLRYLSRESIDADPSHAEIDETGYLFFPAHYNYSFPSYTLQLSKKFRKNCNRESSVLKASGITFRHNDISDLDDLFRMNISAFGEKSYFFDPRFLNSFEHLVQWLRDNGMLRITTVVIGGKTAAVDVGAVRGRHYTVLAGGTNPEFMGVAKIINFHHIERSCAERLETVDFLCGDFGWKERFHLSPRPLYKVNVEPYVMQDTGRVYTCTRKEYAF